MPKCQPKIRRQASAVVAKVVGATSSEAVGAFLVYCMMSVNVPDTN